MRSDLHITVSIACVDHECDGCGICAMDECCRRDRPDYRLPALGSIVPYFGELGVRNTDGKRIECHICGKWYLSLGGHIWAAHRVFVDEYRSAFGLGRKGLGGERGFEIQSERARRAYVTRGPLPHTRVTAEQHASARSSLEATIIHRQSAATMNAHRPADIGRRISDGQKERRETAMRDLTCQVCGAPFRRLHSQARKTCSHRCLRRLISAQRSRV